MEQMRKAWTPVLVALLSPMAASALCTQSALTIETTAFTFSGCYQESPYAGLYETKVWTIEGRDVAEFGTKAILADLQNGPLVDPVWVIGTVTALPQNSWSDGYNSGLEVVNLVCTGTSAFWETEDPAQEIHWTCDTDGDGVTSVPESGDLAVTCGCAGMPTTISTPAPMPPAPTPAPTTPEPTVGVGPQTPAPAAADGYVPTPNPAVIFAVDPTPVPISGGADSNQMTPAPIVGGTIAPTAPACNLTLASDDMQDMSGCYARGTSSNARGRWVKLDETAVIEWQEAQGSNKQGNWVVLVAGFGLPDEIKCIGSNDVEDPTEIPETSWYCDLDGKGSYTPAVSFDFEALTCTGSCEIATSVESLDSEGSDGSTGRTMAIVVGSVVSGVGVAAIVIIGALLLKRRKRGATTNGAGPTENADPADPSAPAPIPVFEPWGTRPAPR
ncbi:unnamed protein product, partial [Ectocarpus sp. 6 AP-2014]